MKSHRPVGASALAAALAALVSAGSAEAASLQFAGAASVQIADSPSVSITGPITVEAWINRAASGVQHSIVEKYGCPGGGTAPGGFVLRVAANDKLLFGTRDDCNNGASVIGATSIPANTWVHVAGHWDGTVLRVFVNGVQDGAGLASTRPPRDGNTPLKIGERGNGGTPFNGMIDDVRLWSVAKTAAQIAAGKDACLLGTEAGLAAYYQMEEGAGTTTADSTANGNTGTLVAATFAVTGAPIACGPPPPPPLPPAPPATPVASGSALQFNGINASVQIPDSPSVSLIGPMTVEAWIKRAVAGVQHSIVEKYGCSSGQGGYVLRVTADNRLMFGTRDDCNNGSSVTSAGTIPAGLWTHVAGHWDGTTLRVFINGVLSGSLASNRSPKDGPTALKIGERGNGGTPFNGVMDEVRLWNVARSAAQIAAGKDLCLAGGEAGLMGYWQFNEGAGLDANDLTLNENLGAILNAVFVAPGVPLSCNVLPIQVFGSLKNAPTPLPDNLMDFVTDRTNAIRLGKALFWDMQAGGDGLTACASCHFQAGADVRDRNQLNPRASVGPFTANKQMSTGDFPISNGTVMGSQGVRKADFLNIILGSAADNCTPVPDSIFKINDGMTDVNVRQVTGRNSPSAINAIFNFRSFWDGRANNVFNGVNPAGPTDPAARVLKLIAGVPTKVSISLINASLASQAVGPPNNSVEMSCNGRMFSQLGKKMLSLTPLGSQHVDPTDSSLGLLAGAGTGLTTTYTDLIKASFRAEFWDSTAIVDLNKNVVALPTGALDEFTVMEANFPLFWGLSIMLYESTLLANDSPVDRFLDGNLAALSPLQQAGMDVFIGKGRCDHCHGLPMTTDATVFGAALVAADPAEGPALAPFAGFEIIGVRPTADDGGDILQPNQGFFKVPGLRNVELNGPYFHNGGKATLRQVVEFYNRGGDFAVAGRNSQIRPLGLTEGEKQALVSFLMGMTDERVRLQRAPFDHPQLFVPNGHNPDGSDNTIERPATGAGGGPPVLSFLGLNPQQP